MIELLYKKFYSELVHWACGMTGDLILAEEIVQEGFLRVIEHEEQLIPLTESQQRAWIYRTIKNLWIDRTRKRKHEAYLDDEMFNVIPAESDAYESAEWAQVLCLLPELERTFFILRYLNGYTSKQIGELFQMPSGTVRSTLSSARKQLRNMLSSE